LHLPVGICSIIIHQYMFDSTYYKGGINTIIKLSRNK
jgi:hypothetical protein